MGIWLSLGLHGVLIAMMVLDVVLGAMDWEIGLLSAYGLIMFAGYLYLMRTWRRSRSKLGRRSAWWRWALVLLSSPVRSVALLLEVLHLAQRMLEQF